MSGLSSYPRTSGPVMGDPVPRAAYANVPEPLRSKLIADTARHRHAFYQKLPGLEFLVPSYVDPDYFSNFTREDAEGRIHPEPGAQPGPLPASSAALHSSINGSDPAITPLLGQLNTFRGVVEQATHLGDDERIWRFLGAAYTGKDNSGMVIDTYYCNNPAGNFWGVGAIPATEAEWRNTCAIPGIWNGDGGYLSLRLGDLPPALRQLFRTGLIGAIGPQPSMVPGYHFDGGGRQLVVDGDRIKQFSAYFLQIPVHRSAWNT